MAALEEELRMPLLPGEGPVGLILAPSRELARQTFQVVEDFCSHISKHPQYPELRSQLIIGGESIRMQLEILETKGLHCVVATPGRLRVSWIMLVAFFALNDIPWAKSDLVLLLCCC